MNNNFNASSDGNPDYQYQGNIVVPTTPDSQPSPIMNGPGEIKPRLGITKIIMMAIAGILIAGGIAYGAWYAYDNYFASPTLADLMLDSAGYLEKLKIYQIDYELDVELEKSGLSPASIPGSDIFGGLFGDASKQAINLKGYSYIDQSDKENIKFEGDIRLAFGAGMGSLDVSSKLADNIFYFKLNGLPAMLSAFINMDSLEDNWISIDRNQKEGALSKYNDFFGEDDECLEKSKEFMREFLKKNQLHEMVKDCSTEKRESGTVINCRFKIKTAAIQEFIKELAAFEAEQCQAVNMKQFENADWEMFEKINKDIVYDVDFSKKEKYLTKLSVLYKNTQDASSMVKNAVFEVYIDDKVEQKTISAPEKSIGLDEFTKILFSGFMGNMTGGDPSLSPADDSSEFDLFGNAQSKSRDAKRIADIKQVQTALELYYNDNEAYPISADKVVLGQGDFTFLCSNGFSAGICSPDANYYIGSVPTNPEPNGMDYVYSCADGENYEIIFMLENKTGSLAAGLLKASPQGIESMSESSLYAEYMLKDSEDQADKTADSDNDGLSDQEEKQKYFTDINNNDTDGDGYIDGDEVKNGYNPNGDGLLVQ